MNLRYTQRKRQIKRSKSETEKRYEKKVIIAAGCMLIVKCLSAVAAEQRKPNIVFVLIDDMGWSDVGVYGSHFYETPNIDRLAADGMRFTDAYATCHVCSPSRASILTGKYPARLGLTDWLQGRGDRAFQRLQAVEIKQSLSLEETTIAEALRDHGYRTGMFGKWHLGKAEAGPLNQGFDVQVPQNWLSFHYVGSIDAAERTTSFRRKTRIIASNYLNRVD
jgi:arylsulfatase A-like enzyme